MSLTFTSTHDIIVNVVEELLLLVQRLLRQSTIAANEARAETIFYQEFALV